MVDYNWPHYFDKSECMRAKLKSKGKKFQTCILGKTSTTWLVAFWYVAVFPLWIFLLSLSMLSHTNQQFSIFIVKIRWKLDEKKITEKFHATKRTNRRKKVSRRVSLNIVWFCLLPTCSLKEARAINRSIDHWFLIRFLWILLLFFSLKILFENFKVGLLKTCALAQIKFMRI